MDKYAKEWSSDSRRRSARSGAVTVEGEARSGASEAKREFSPPRLKLFFQPLLRPEQKAMDKSWMGSERGTSRYIEGFIDFVEFAKRSEEDTDRITSKKMFIHLINNGSLDFKRTEFLAHDLTSPSLSSNRFIRDIKAAASSLILEVY
ncbi:hypothetical protein QQ045_017463 [Rhodiola kirilowii]